MSGSWVLLFPAAYEAFKAWPQAQDGFPAD
jgi:hypothetical protein